MSRQPHEEYSTPAPVTEAVCEWLERRRYLQPDDVIVDPFAGPGAILQVFQRRGYATMGKDIQEKNSNAELRISVGDSFVDMIGHRGQVVVTNPPFSKAEEAVRLLLDRHSTVVVLLRSAFAGTQRRGRWLFAEGNRPEWILPLLARPSFVNGRTDNSEYSWFVWTGVRNDDPRVQALDWKVAKEVAA